MSGLYRELFTEAERRKSESAPTFANVQPSQCFGPKADCALSNRVAMANIVRWHELKRQWLLETGQIPRPDSYYD